MAIVAKYLEDFTNYIKEYGPKTACLIQIGGFYEIYSKDDPSFETYNIIQDVSNICDLAIVPRCSSGSEYILGGGFGVHVIDKYTKKLNDSGYTCIIISQDSNCKNTTRSVNGVLTPGTYIDDNINVFQSKNITCLWIEHIKNNLYVGISNINIITGESHIFQYDTPYSHLPNIYDTIEKYITVYNPNETIIIYNLNNSTINNVIQYVNIKSLTRLVDLNNKTDLNTINALKCEKQRYQQEIFKTYFKMNDEHSFMQQFIYNDFSSQSFCYLIDFLVKLNPFLIKQINIPKIDNLTDRLILANHSLLQLNVTSTNTSKNSSLLSLTDNTITPMGKRNFANILLNPSTDIGHLNKQYDITDNLIKNKELYQFIRNNLQNIKDLDKILKLSLLQKLSPKSMYLLFNNLETISLLYKKISSQKFLKEHFNLSIDVYCKKVQKYIKDKLDIEKIKTVSIIEENIFNKGLYSNIDKLEKEYLESIDKLKKIVEYINSIMTEDQNPKKPTVYAKLNLTEKSGFNINITGPRSVILKNIIKNYKLQSVNKLHPKLEFLSSYSNNSSIFTLPLDTIEISNSKNNYYIGCKLIDTINNSYVSNKSKIKELVQEKYIEFLNGFVEYVDMLKNISSFVGDIDVLQNRVYIATKFNYCRPNIIECEKSFFNSKKLRHPIIEQLSNNEIYVPNDISIGNDDPSMLIFGTNAVGKTSLIKACGCAIIMAQAGLYVPADSFTFYPYKQLFTRILNNDNMFKGLSTFTLEMSEMSNILKYSDQYSLILGDELCSGTELRSALCIFISGITKLHEKNSSFIFATHFHELLEFDEIKKLDNLIMKHMQVSYDESSGDLIYDRLLKDGSGESIYGLEVCKSLHLPSDFLNYAFELLNKYYIEYKTPLDFKESRYNSKKIKGLCEICNKNEGNHVHHLQYQQNANNEGFIGSFHKNNIANLINICEECHNNIHENNVQYIKKKTSNGIKLFQQTSI